MVVYILLIMKSKQNILILPDIRSAENVGAIFRTADAVGMSKIYLVGITPAPVDRFGRGRSDIAKSALGAEKSVQWEQRENLVELINELKENNFKIIALEQDEKSIDYKDVQIGENNVFLLGAETTGLPKEILDMCDVIAEIPMKGEKESLNVSVAFGIAIFRILNI